MSVQSNYAKVNDHDGMRGFSNLFRKESGAWWGTRRWWINALLWSVLLCGLTGIMLVMTNEEIYLGTHPENHPADGLMAFILSVGLDVFFDFGVPVVAIGTVVLAQDLIIREKQNGVTEWLLSKPVTRRAYILSKLAANLVPVMLLLVGLPSLGTYGLVCLRMGAMFPLAAFLPAVGFMALNTLFYHCLTLMLGTIFNHRAPILGITLGSILGGGLLGSFFKQFFYFTPWMLPKAAWLTATGQVLDTNLKIAALVSTALWSLIFSIAAEARFEKTEC